MLQRQRSGSVVCPSCGRLVGVNNQQCPHCGRPSPGMFGYSRVLQGLADGDAFVPFVTIVCVVLYGIGALLSLRVNAAGGMMGLLSVNGEILYAFGASGAVPVFLDGRWWTPLSANWLHGNLIHILFNMMWFRQLAPAVIRMFGAGRGALIYILGGVCGFVVTSFVGAWIPLPGMFRGAGMTIGASAAVFSLFGALIVYGQRTGNSGLTRQVWTWVGFAVVFGIMMPGIDNWAHFGGLGGGYLVASMLDPMKPERAEHLLGALALTALSLLAVVASVLGALLG